MSDNKKSNNVWVYGVILFTSAFIVLLFAGYSQIKLNKNLYSYKIRVQDTESKINVYKQNFASAQEMNTKLNEEISQLKGEIENLKNEIAGLTDEKERLTEKLEKRNLAEESLSHTINLYLDGNVVEAAESLKDIDLLYLGDKSFETFRRFSQKIRSEAGKILYDEGYSLYKKGKYKEAAEKLVLSYRYSRDETYSDNCLYYLAYAELKSGDKISALEHMKKLVEKYPDSWFFKLANSFIRKYGG